METPDKKELITEMVNLLKGYEEPYEEGAWEDFKVTTKSRKGTYLLWIGIAALFAVILSAMPFIFDNNVAVEQAVVKSKITVKPPLKTHQDDIQEPLPGRRRSVVQQSPGVVVAEPSKLNSPVPVQIPLVSTIEIVAEVATSSKSTATPTQVPAVQPSDQPKIEPPRKKTFSEFLAEETKVVSVPRQHKGSKWNFGVELLPTVLQSKVNLGAGITTEYKLSDKFSISSGISYIALNAGQKVADPQPVSLMSNKKLVAFDANIKAIDIPISLTFNVNKRLYTAIGMSYFNVISEQRSNDYLTQLEVSATALNSATGQIEDYQTKVSRANTELSEDVPLDGNSYLGFMNFSIGHKQTISKNHQFIIEPFLKVPVGKLSTEDLKLSNGGVKLRFSF
jgi:hypothetical protein